MNAETIEAILTGSEGTKARAKRLASVTLKKHVIGRNVADRIPAARSLWTRVMLRDTAFTGRHTKLRRLYSLEDPWDMASEREQYRFEQTNEILTGIAPHFGNILELGCGEGHQSLHLSALTDELRGLELSQKAVERARSRCPGASFQVGGIENAGSLLSSTRFDLIVACEVLYYVRDTDEVISELQSRAERIFVSNYLPRSEVIRGHFEGEGWRRLPDICHGDAVWECFVWEASEVRNREPPTQ